MAKVIICAELRIHFSTKFKKSGEDECWLWRASLMHKGYGHFCWKRKVYRAHRIAWYIAHDRDPGRQQVRHTCDTPACVNPAHLVVGSAKQNSADMVRRGRSASGARNPNAKLTLDQVDAIKKQCAYRLQKDVAQEFGVSSATVSMVVNEKIWR